MKKNKFLFVTFLVLSLILAACSKPPSSSTETSGDSKSSNNSETFVIKAGHAVAVEHYGHKTFLKFKEIVEKNSNGRIVVEIYPNGQVGGEREMIEAIQLGNLTMAAPSASPLVPFAKEMAIFDAPFLFTERDQAYSVLDGEVGQELLDSLLDKGLQPLVYWENGFRHITNNGDPIKSVNDMEGLKFRTLESPIQIKMWNATGANSTAIAFTELYAALQQKTIDAEENTLPLIVSQKFYEVQENLTLSGHLYGPWVVIMNNQFYESLPEDLQKVVMDAAIEVQEYNRQLSKEDEEKALEYLKQQGMNIIEIGEAEKNEFKEKMSTVYEDIKAEVGAEIFDKMMAEIEK